MTHSISSAPAFDISDVLPPHPRHWQSHRDPLVTVTSIVFRDHTTRQKRTSEFVTRPESRGCTYEVLTFIGNIFASDVLFLDPCTPALSTLGAVRN